MPDTIQRTFVRAPIRVRADEFDLLAALTARQDQTPGRRLLAAELERAQLVDDDQADDFVHLGSRVDYRDLDSRQIRTIRLVLAASEPGDVSAVAPVGAALLGLSVGETFVWEDANGRQRLLEVVAVSHDG